jgi:TolB-like protein
MDAKRLLLSFILLIFLVHGLFAAEPTRVAVIDFQVQSDNPQYKYLGKGFAEFVAIEILKSGQLMLIERDKRNKILEELEFSLTDLADPENQIKVGRLLAASYLITGNIYDFAGRLSITYELISTETSEIVLKDKIDGEVRKYDFLTASIAKSIIDYFALKVPEEMVAKVEREEVKEEEVVVRFSEAIEAYDKKDVEKAKTELKRARKLDPKNRAVVVYLDKLTLNTSKFKTITEQYYLPQNPAYLGIIQYDRMYFVSAVNFMTSGDWKTIDLDPSLKMRENDKRFLIGYQLPLFEHLGVEVNYFYTSIRNEVWDPVNQPTATGGGSGTGAMIGLGWNPVDFLSVGAALALYAQKRNGWAEDEFGSGTVWYEDPTYFRQAFSGGVLLKNRQSSVVLDLLAGYSLEKILFFDITNFPDNTKRSLMEERSAPLFNENTLTLALNERKTFFIVKQLNDIYLETGAYYGRLMPAVEHWLIDWLAVRGGVEGGLTRLTDDTNFGVGGTAGLTFRITRWNADLDVNVTYRHRPSRFLDGEFIDEILPFITISKSKSFAYK